MIESGSAGHLQRAGPMPWSERLQPPGAPIRA